MRCYKVVDLVRKRIGANAHVIRRYAVFLLNLVERLDQSNVRGAVGQEAYLRSAVLDRKRPRHQLACAFELARKPIHDALVFIGLLGIAGSIVVARTAREVRSLRMLGAGQRTPADGVAVHVPVARKAAQPLEVFSGEHLAAVERLFRILKRLGHPVVHAQIEIGEHEDRRLQTFSEIECGVAEVKALLDRSGQQNDVLGVAVGEERGRKQIGLRSTRRHSRRGTAALHIEDDARNLSKVAEARELRHERDAGAGGGSHGTRTSPAGAKHHTDGSEFVLSLDNGEARLALGSHAELLEQIGGGLYDRGGRCDGIPRNHRNASEHRAHAARSVAVDDDLAGGLVHLLNKVRVLLGEPFLGEVEARLDGAEVQVEDLLLLLELLLQTGLDNSEVNREKLRHHAYVDHVLDQLAQLGLRADGGGDLVEGYRVADHVGAVLLQVQVLLIDGHATDGQREDVLLGSLSIQRHQDLRIALSGYVAVFAGANGVPGGESGDVGGKKVFPADGNTHSKNTLQQHAVGGLRAGSVHRCYVDAEVVGHARVRVQFALLLTEGEVSCRHLAGCPFR